MPAKKGARKTDKKDAILDAMLDLVVERGLDDAPMSAVADRSGASPGVIYHYFPSKDDLIRKLYERVAGLKREAFLDGYSDAAAPREALLKMWLNAYQFYRTHPKELRFLDQYLNSSYCSPGGEPPDPSFARVGQLLRPRKQGGILKDLPPEAIQSLTLGLASSLARAPKAFSPATLRHIAETVWAAIADE
jgi:TetR/AcrR family transcriptional regulator, repressor of fatR-cypB operon